jgi:hypothetical protein
MKIFIVLHHEIMGTMQDYSADEMVFYTCSSLTMAVNLIRKSGVCRWSWWEIRTQQLNSRDWSEHFGYYGPRGGKLRKAPYEKCVAMFIEAQTKLQSDQ